MSQPDPIARAKRAASSKRRADDQYRAALVAAVSELEQAGARDVYARVAAAAGISRQAVRQMIERVRI